MAKNKLPSNDEIIASTYDIEKRLKNIQNGKEKIGGKETIQDKLDLIKDTLLKFRDSGLSYPIIRQVILEETEKQGKSLKISEQTLRAYCQNKLGFPKKERKKTKKTNKKIESTNQKTKENKKLNNGNFTEINEDI